MIILDYNMNKSVLKQRLREAGKSAVRLAQGLVYNKIPDNLVFIIKPNCPELNDNLDHLEREYCEARNKEVNRKFNIDEAVDRLFIGDRIPAWVECSIIRVTKGATVIQLQTSRRFQSHKELLDRGRLFPLFNVMVQYPPYHSVDSKEKFDVNWQFNRIRTSFMVWKTKWIHN